jgi:hypothetical protein
VRERATSPAIFNAAESSRRGDEIGNAEPGGDVNRTRDVVTGDHPIESKGRR